MVVYHSDTASIPIVDHPGIPCRQNNLHTIHSIHTGYFINSKSSMIGCHFEHIPSIHPPHSLSYYEQFIGPIKVFFIYFLSKCTFFHFFKKSNNFKIILCFIRTSNLLIFFSFNGNQLQVIIIIKIITI